METCKYGVSHRHVFVCLDSLWRNVQTVGIDSIAGYLGSDCLRCIVGDCLHTFLFLAVQKILADGYGLELEVDYSLSDGKFDVELQSLSGKVG